MLVHIPASRNLFTPGDYSTTQWVINNAANLGLLSLTVPWILCVLRDFSQAKRAKSPKPILAHVPCLVFIISWPFMYLPHLWILSYVGVS